MYFENAAMTSRNVRSNPAIWIQLRWEKMGTLSGSFSSGVHFSELLVDCVTLSLEPIELESGLDEPVASLPEAFSEVAVPGR